MSNLNETIAGLKLLTWSVQLNDVDVSPDCCFPSQIPFLEILRWTVGFFNVVCLAFSCSCNKLQGQFHRPRGLHRFFGRSSSSRRSVPAVHVHSDGVHRLRRGATGTLTALQICRPFNTRFEYCIHKSYFPPPSNDITNCAGFSWLNRHLLMHESL